MILKIINTGLIIIVVAVLLIFLGLYFYKNYISSSNKQIDSNLLNSQNAIPFHVGDEDLDNYSIKLTNKNNGISTTYSGKFVTDFPERNTSLQRMFMELIELTIQQNVNPDFSIGPLPTPGKPYSVTLKPKDILISFTDRGDYLIFGEDLIINFYSVEQSVETYDFNIDGPTFNFVSTYYDITYSGTYNTYGNFSMNINSGSNIDNNLSLETGDLTYDNVTISKQILANGIVLYKSLDSFPINVTILPEPLPNTIKVAGYIPGIFSTKTVKSSFDVVKNYILNRYNFNSDEKSKVINILRQLYYTMEYSIRYGIGFKDRYTYSSNNGFTNYSNTNDFILDIRIS